MPSSTLTSIDLAGDLRRHRRPAPRRDVAGRVQHRGLDAGRALRDRGRLDFHGARPVHVAPRAAPPASGEHRRAATSHFTHGRGLAFGRTVDFEGGEFVFERRHPAGFGATGWSSLTRSAHSAVVPVSRHVEGRDSIGDRKTPSARRSAYRRWRLLRRSASG